MATKEIKIKVATEAELGALRSANTELALMAFRVGRNNQALRQDMLAASREMYSFGNVAESTASKAILSAKQIEEAWKKAMAKAPTEATKGMSVAKQIISGALKGIGGAFSGIGQMFVQGGIWGAMSAAATKVFTLIWDHFKEKAERAAKRAERAFKESTNEIKDSVSNIDKAFDSSVSAIDKAISRYVTLIDKVKELTKAEIEHAKQIAIANGMDATKAETAAKDLSQQVDYNAEREKLQNTIENEQKRIDASKDAEKKSAEEIAKATKLKTDAEAEYQKKREENEKRALQRAASLKSFVTEGREFTLTDEEKAATAKKANEEFEESKYALKQREKIRGLKDQIANIDTGNKARAAAEDAQAKIEAAQIALDTLAEKQAAQEQAVRNKDFDKSYAKTMKDFNRYEESGSSMSFSKWREEEKKKADEDLKRQKEEYAKFLEKAGYYEHVNPDDVDTEDADFKAWKKNADDKAKKEAEESKKAAEKKAEEDKKAAEKAAAEREKLDKQEATRKERERQKELADKIRDHQKLLAAERAEESKTRSAVSAAESKLQQAWGWYRDKDSMAAQLQEEKADAEARKQFEKDFEKLKDRRRDWRTAENLSVDDEAVRRVALAREEKEQAEKHLAEIEKNTADLAAKLDELLQVKG